MRALLLLGLTSCSEYDVIFNKDDAPTPGDDTAAPSCEPCPDSEPPQESEPGDSLPPDSGAPELSEVCNGRDDDADGAIDEGFADADGDGLADCLDEDCAPDPVPEGPADVAFDPWDIVLEWSYADYGYVLSAIVTGQLDDDNGDGAVDGQDIPELIGVTRGADVLFVVSGDGSLVQWTVTGVMDGLTPAVADIDQDGENEVVIAASTGEVVALDAGGTPKWVSAERIRLANGPNATVADLDGDGDVEVIVDDLVLSGADGSFVARLESSWGSVGWAAHVIADIDDDGDMEILYGHDVFDHTGERLWSVTPWTIGNRPIGYSNQQWAVFQADEDPEAELVFVQGTYGTGQRLYFMDHEGEPWFVTTLTEGKGVGPPCVADFDGDGESEVAVPGGKRLHLFEASGRMAWTAVTRDRSGSAGCAAFDFNGDGAAELVFGDESLRVLDGRTGLLLYEDPTYHSGTAYEIPTIGDVDGDGSAEIVVGGYPEGLRVYGHRHGYFVDAGRAWPVHDFSEVRFEDDGAVLSNPTPTWQQQDLLRSRPGRGATHRYPNLEPVLGGACVADCRAGPAELAWGVKNSGAAPAEAGALAQVLALEEDGGERLLLSVTLPALGSGRQLSLGQVALPPSTWERGVILRVDVEDAVQEGDEADNTLTWTNGLCEEGEDR
ncbi:MAG: VCBS repeat-containing protein [Alphaproteobacteria bacterium]|nr:VCBS repeat-containing protein [Alphaproteobacteria bacterium]